MSPCCLAYAALEYPLLKDVLFYDCMSAGLNAVVLRSEIVDRMLSNEEAVNELVELYCSVVSSIKRGEARFGEDGAEMVQLALHQVLLSEVGAISGLKNDSRNSLLLAAVECGAMLGELTLPFDILVRSNVALIGSLMSVVGDNDWNNALGQSYDLAKYSECPKRYERDLYLDTLRLAGEYLKKSGASSTRWP